MANMSYCQFENTSRDLRQCVSTIEEALDQGTLQREFLKSLNESERQSYKVLAVECMKFLNAYDEMHETEMEIVEEEADKIQRRRMANTNDNS